MKHNQARKVINYSPLVITATLRQSRLMEDMVEGMAGIRLDAMYDRKPVLDGWKAIETSTIDFLAGGDLVLSDTKDISRTSFVTSFLFTCIKNREEGYSLAWSSSLS